MANTIETHREHKVDQFADDTCLYVQERCMFNLTTITQQLIDNLLKYCDKWRIKLNPQKTQTILFQNKANNYKETQLKLKLRDTHLKPEKTAKLLGVTFQRNARFTEHLKVIKKSATTKLNTLGGLRDLRGNS